MWGNSETTVRMIYGESLSIINNGCLVAKLRIGEGQTTRTQVRRLQANGSRNGLPLTDNAEGEEIVYSL